MSDIRQLWWDAGRMAYPLPQEDWYQAARWHDSLRRIARLLEPVWPKDWSTGPFSYSLGSLALLLYAGPYDRSLAKVADVPVTAIIEALGAQEPDPGPADVIRDGLIARGHDLDADDDPISALFRTLTVYHPPVETQVELPAFLQFPGGTMMQWGTEWAYVALKSHYPAEATAAATEPPQR